MNDESLTPPAELASAALDGHTTADERATVESSTALRDEMSFYGELRDRLCDVPVPADARESAFAAALAVFDEIRDEIRADSTTNSTTNSADDEAWTDATSATSSPALTPTVAPVISLHERRKRQYRWLGGAAAAAVAVVIAAGAINGGFSADESTSNADMASISDESTASAKSAGPDVAGSSGDAFETTAGTTANTTAESATEAATGAADSSEALDAPLAVPETTAQAGLESAASPAAFDPWVDAPQLADRYDVLRFIDSLSIAETTAASVEVPPAETVGSATGGGSPDPFACLAPYAGPSAPALFQGRQVFVVDDNANGTVVIIDPVDCTVIESFAR